MDKLKAINWQEWDKFVAREMNKILNQAMSLDAPNMSPVHPEYFWLDEPFGEPEDYGFYIVSNGQVDDDIPF